MKLERILVPGLILALSACQGSEGGGSADALAQAGDVELTVDAAAEILAPQRQLPNQPQVVEALANLWVDYFLLARMVAEDSTLATLNVDALVDQTLNQELVLRLRDQVIQVDTTISDAEVQEIYARELPGARLRARHILLQFPQNTTPAQTDSVRALADSLRERILAGEDFGGLAREYSQDPGSGANGGDLGSFGRGEMVTPFEEAAFSLQEGEISPVVETNFGLHIIRVDERIVPPLEEGEAQFRAQLQNRRVAEAESTFVAGIIESAEVDVVEGEFGTVRQLAETPDMELTARAEGRPLVTYAGGSYTVGDLRDWLLIRPGSLRSEIQGATDEQLEGLLRNLTRERLLVRAAREEGIEVPPDRSDSLSTAIRTGVRGVARQLGFLALRPAEGESLDDAAFRTVVDLLTEVVRGEREVIPLGGVSFALRKQFDARINRQAFDRTLARVTELRTQLPSAPPPLGEPGNPDEAPPIPDSGSAGG